MALDRKDRYAEIGDMFRHYLDWRAKLFAGYFAILAGLALAFVWTTANVPSRSWLVTLSGVVVSGAFILLDLRNRENYYACLAAGAALEADGEGEHGRGLYTVLNESGKWLPNTYVIAGLQAIIGAFLIGLTVSLFSSGGAVR
jgi:hypothetical protein